MRDAKAIAESIGQASDRIDNLIAATQFPLPPQVHLDQLRKILPEIRDELRAAVIELTGKNPWEHHPASVEGVRYG